MEHLFTRDVPQRNGIHAAAATDYYWGVLPREMMVDLNTLCAAEGVSTALKKFDFKGNRFDYASEPGRADFLYFLPITKESVVLDLGSGYGNIAHELSRHAGSVVAADATYELLRFSKMRADEAGARNMDFVHIDPLEHDTLPFKEKTFDVIVLNGVLEWVGSGTTTGDPREHQLRLLRRLSRLLKDGGVLCVAIENRLHPQWWARDPHAKMSLVAMLPRFVANVLAKRRGLQDGYRTYIYGKGGYRRLFGRAGFSSLRFHYPFSTYRSPKFIYGDDARGKLLFKSGLAARIYTPKWQTFLRFATYLGLDSTFLSSFIIVVGKGQHGGQMYGRTYFSNAPQSAVLVKESEGGRRLLRLYDRNGARVLAEHRLD